MATLQPAQLAAYADRIKLPGGLCPKQRPSLQLVSDIVQQHQRTIPFENLSLVHHKFKRQDQGRILIDLDSVFDKLVTRKRGGYCFENNSLLAAVLRTLDFDLYTTAARVIPDPHAGSSDEVVMNGFDHQLTLVQLDGCSWAVDVGFGSKVPRQPVPLLPAVEDADRRIQPSISPLLHMSGPLLHKVRRGIAGSKSAPPQPGQEHLTGWYMQVWSDSQECWEDQYFFMEVEFNPADYQVLNASTSGPEAWFSQRMVAAIQTHKGRVTLDDWKLRKFVRRRDKLQLMFEVALQSEEARDSALDKYFGIEQSFE